MDAAQERNHGYARYKLDGCRCYTCGFAASQYREDRARAIAYGTWAPWVDAEPVRTHLRALADCGLGLRTVATLSGLGRKQLFVILNGRTDRGTPPPAKVRPDTASKVLSVEPSAANLPGATVILAIGTRRRLQALVCAGWPQHHLAEALGMIDTNFSTLLGREQVLVRTARAVQALYDERWQQNPRHHGVGAAAFTRARNHAARLAWAPVGAWDDDTIDDPTAVPDLGERVSRVVELAENAEELEEYQGYTREQAAERLGVTKDALQQAIGRYRGITQPASEKAAA